MIERLIRASILPFFALFFLLSYYGSLVNLTRKLRQHYKERDWRGQNRSQSTTQVKRHTTTRRIKRTTGQQDAIIIGSDSRRLLWSPRVLTHGRLDPYLENQSTGVRCYCMCSRKQANNLVALGLAFSNPHWCDWHVGMKLQITRVPWCWGEGSLTEGVRDLQDN